MSSVALNRQRPLLWSVSFSPPYSFPRLCQPSCPTLDSDKHLHWPAEPVCKTPYACSRRSNQYRPIAYLHPTYSCLPRSMPKSILWLLSWIPMLLPLWCIPYSSLCLKHQPSPPSLSDAPAPASSTHLPSSEPPGQVRDTTCSKSTTYLSSD